MAEYLVKPVLREDFVEALERILEREPGEEDAAQEETGTPGDKYSVAADVKRYIEEHFDQDLSLDILGEQVNLHPVYLSRIFKEVTDWNLSGYITDVRMRKAAEFLDGTNLKVQDVMSRLGYRKRQHFNKLFKEKYGMTPKEYRARKR